MLKRLASTFQSGLNTAVAATRDGVNRALPGNPALRDYDIGEQTGTGGTNGVWDVYAATKKTGKGRCSVWIFDKQRHLNGFDKTMKENCLALLRHGVLSLCRLQHPRILSVERRLEESNYSLVFVTERIQGSVDFLLSKRDVETDSQCGLYDVELRYGLLQVAEALSFLHEQAKQFHGNLTPYSIAVTDKGSWKLAGLEFATKRDDDNFRWMENYPTLAAPAPAYIPPDLFEHKVIDPSRDAFSFGVLLYRCYGGQTVLDPSVYDAQRVITQEASKYNHPALLHRLPVEVRDHVKLLLSNQRELRPTPDQLRQISFFQSAGALTLHYLDTLLQRPQQEKDQFFRDLPSVIDTLPARVRNGIVINALQPEIANQSSLVNLLPPVFKIVELATGDEFHQRILPVISDLFNTQSAKACSIMIEHLPLMLNKLTEAKKPDEVRNYLLPLLGRALAQEKQTNLQAKSLEVIPALAEHLDEATLKSNLVPKIKGAALSESCSAPVKVSILVAIGQILPRLDRWFIMDSILDWVPKMIERTPGVLVAVLGVYSVLLMDDKLGMTKEFIANNALPTLLPLSMDSSLSLNQFQSYMTVIRTMLDKIEQEQTNKLKSISEVKGENMSQKVTLDSIRGANNSGPATPTGLGDFGSLSMKPTPTSTPKLQSSTPKTGMSLQEKEAAMRQADEEARLKSQPSLIKKAADPGPKDLTATLMAKNMNMMPKTSIPMSTTMSPMSTMPPMGMSTISPMSTFPSMSNSVSMPGGLAPLSNQPAIMPPPQPMMQPMGMSFSQPMSVRPQQQQQNSGGWTLNNPMTAQGMMTPMNVSNPQPQNGAKKLTASELADFLN